MAASIQVSGGYFGARWPCFGMLHEADPGSGHAVLVVNDFGTRAMDAYWTFRRLAERLSEAGVTVLRFDLPGTGDSPAGNGNRVDVWDAAVEDALLLLRDQGFRRLTVVGYGLGAILALNAALRNPDVQTAELIQPFLGGERYLVAVTSSTEQGRGDERGGFVCSHFLSASEERSLRGLRAEFLRRDPPLVVELTHVEGDDCEAFQEQLRISRHSGRVHPATGYELWQKDSAYNQVPAFFEEIVQRVGRPGPPAETRRPVSLRVREESADREYVEEVVHCPGLDGQPLHGVLAVPGRAPDHGGIVLILGTAANRRSGMHDNGTLWARSLAAGGVPTLRFDASGFGDSRPRSGAPDNEVLVDRNHTDCEPWLIQLARRGFVRFGAMGVSSGGFNAFKLCQRFPEVHALFGVNVARFVGMSFAQAVHEDIRPSHTYWKLLFDRATWARLLRGEIQVWRVGSVLAQRIRGRLRSALALRLAGAGRNRAIGPGHRDMLEFLARPRAAAHLVCCEGDQWLENFEKEFGHRAAAMAGHPGFTVTFLSGVDHGISDPQEALRVGELARSFFARAFAQAASS